MLTVLFSNTFPYNPSVRKKSNTFSWVYWLEHAIHLKACLINWDENVPIPGINCTFKSLSMKESRTMVEAYQTNSEAGNKKEKKIAIIGWSKGMNLSDDF